MSTTSIIDIGIIQILGHYLMTGIMTAAVFMGLVGLTDLCSSTPRFGSAGRRGLILINILFVVGFLMLCWLHPRIYQLLPLELSEQVASWLNRQLAASNRGA